MFYLGAKKGKILYRKFRESGIIECSQIINTIPVCDPAGKRRLFIELQPIIGNWRIASINWKENLSCVRDARIDYTDYNDNAIFDYKINYEVYSFGYNFKKVCK